VIVQEKHPNVPLIEVDELAEISWGDWDGIQSPNLVHLLSSWESGDYHGLEKINIAKSPSGESPYEVEKRAMPAFYDCILNRPETNIVFIRISKLISAWSIIAYSLIFPFVS
jgi:broad specificity phosphatase PhoE